MDRGASFRSWVSLNRRRYGFAVLHAWGQTLLFHPHLHCVLTGGGLSPDGTQGIGCRAGFFLAVRVLSPIFRRLFLEQLISAFEAGHLQFFASRGPLQDRTAFLAYLAPAREAEWAVYAKRPFAGPEQVLGYVGRYPPRVALPNNRLLALVDGQVSFRYKDYRHDAQPTDGDYGQLMRTSTLGDGGPKGGGTAACSGAFAGPPRAALGRCRLH